MFKALLQNIRDMKMWQVLKDKPASPRELFGSVFDEVQLSCAFADSKTFVDAVPRQESKKITEAYYKQNGTSQDLTRFVYEHFELPEIIALSSPDSEQTIFLPVREHIETMWSILTRSPNSLKSHSSLVPLPHQHIVSGGRFREIYYWDSYFISLGLRESGHYELIESMVKNLAYLVDTYGFIANGNRTYYLTRSQPPVFALMVELLAEVQGEQTMVTYLPDILKEYKYWMRGTQNSLFSHNTADVSEHVVRMQGGELMNRYWDTSVAPREESFVEDVTIGKSLDNPEQFYRDVRAGAESGWDFSSRWFANSTDLQSIRTTDIVPIDLNVLLLKMEEIIARAYQLKGSYQLSSQYDTLASKRRGAIQTYLWDEQAGWFNDYIYSKQEHSSELTIAGAFALYGGVATAEQAPRMVEVIRKEFMRPGGVATTLKCSGQQWDAPNGWAPLQYIVIQGLERYGESELAEDIAQKWCSLNISKYHQTGQLFEKYNIENTNARATGGEYDVQAGFGWTNGVLLNLMNRYDIEDNSD